MNTGSSPRLPRRQLGLWDAVAIYVGIILGSGIFFAPQWVANAAPGWLASLALWAVGAFVAACGAACYAECGARLPYDGGFYVFYRKAYGEGTAFVGGWVAVAVTYPASVAFMAFVFADYFAKLTGLPAGAGPITAVGAVVVAAGLNAFGLRSSAAAQRLLTASKVFTVIALCLAALFAGAPEHLGEQPALHFNADLTMVLAALVGILWSYSGWSDVTLISGELREPGRNLGRTVVIGTTVIFALYALMQLAVMSLLPHSAVAASQSIVADAVATAFGGRAGRLMAAVVVLSVFGAINGTMLVASRLGYAMAQDRLLPAWFGALHPRFATPTRSLAILGIAAIFYVLSGSPGTLLGMFTFSVWIFYSLSAVALLKLRHRKIGEPPTWRAPGGITAPLVVLLTAAGMSASLLADPNNRQQALTGLLLLCCGVPIYLLWRKFARRGAPPRDITE